MPKTLLRTHTHAAGQTVQSGSDLEWPGLTWPAVARDEKKRQGCAGAIPNSIFPAPPIPERWME